MKFSPRLHRLLHDSEGRLAGETDSTVELVIFGTRRIPRSLECGAATLLRVGTSLTYCVVRVPIELARLQVNAMEADTAIKAADLNSVWVQSLHAPSRAARDLLSTPANLLEKDRLQAPVFRRWSGEGVRMVLLDSGIHACRWLPEDRILHFGTGRPNFTGRPNPHATLIAGLWLSTYEEAPGLCPEADVHDVRIFDEDGTADVGSIVGGLDLAASLGPDVINCSWGSMQPSPPIRLSILALAESGILLTCAAGNDGAPAEGEKSTVGWPARIRHPNVLSIGSIDAQYRISDFSSRSVGSLRHIDLVEFGEQLISTYPDELSDGDRGLCADFAGTSFSAPRVAGCLASVIHALRVGGAEGPRGTAVGLVRKAARTGGGDSTRALALLREVC